MLSNAYDRFHGNGLYGKLPTTWKNKSDPLGLPTKLLAWKVSHLPPSAFSAFCQRWLASQATLLYKVMTDNNQYLV